MGRARKPAHISTPIYLGDQGLGRPTIDAGDSAKERHFLLLAQRGEVHPLYLFAKSRYGLVEVVDVGQNVCDHEGVLRRKVPFEGLFERRDLLAQTPLGQSSAKTSGSVVALRSASIIARPEEAPKAPAWGYPEERA